MVAQAVDLFLLGWALVVIANRLPDGPPPASSMAFFTAQHFVNYYILVGAALLLTILVFLSIKFFRATPAQLLLKLQLQTLDGKLPSNKQLFSRLITALRNIILIMLPGPIIALAVGIYVSNLISVPFTSTDNLLVQLEIPKNIRYAIHGISFIALIAAIWMVAIRPTLKYFERANGGLTRLDVKSQTTHVYRRHSQSIQARHPKGVDD